MSRSGQVLLRGVGVLGFVAACNVYTPELLKDDDNRDPFANGGTNSMAGSSSSGGYAGVVSPAGGAPYTGGSTGVGGAGGYLPSTGGTAGTGASSGGTGGDAVGGSGGTAAGTGGSGVGGASVGGASTGGTNAGGTNAGGSGGTGTTFDPCVDPAPGDEELIDDFEDDDERLTAAGGRNGVWYVFNDGTTGTQSPDPETNPLPILLPDAGAPSSTQALNMTASGFTTWGTGIGADFVNPKDYYDASAYQGVTFWAKVGASGYTKVRFMIPDTTTEPVGGKCNPAAAAPNGQKCSNHFGVGLTLTTSWRKCRVDFDKLTQIAGWGLTAPSINAAELYGVQFTIKQAVTVDLWIDDVAFVLK